MRTKHWLKTLPAKLWIALAALIAFTFFSNDFGLVDIQKTAIILAAGVDRTEEGFELTAQIAVPKGSDRTTGGTASVEIAGRGATVADCLAAIYAQTGWVPKLVFCDLILLGEEAARSGALDALDFFLRNEYSPDSCLLAVCKGSAGETLKAASAIDDASSLALEKLFSDAAKRSGRVMTATMREFAIGHYGASASGYMPYVRMIAQKGPEEGAGGGQNTAAEEGEEKLFSAEQTALFSAGRMTGILTEEETAAFSLLKGNVYGGALPAGDATLAVLKNSGGVSLQAETLTAKLSIGLKVRIAARAAASSPENVATNRVTQAECLAAEQALEKAVRSLWARCAEAECDLFFLRRTLWRRSPEKYAALKDTPLSEIALSTEISVEGLR